MFSVALNEIAAAIDSENLSDDDLCRILTLRTFSMLGAASTFFTTVDGEGTVHTRGSFGLTDEAMESWQLYPLKLELPTTDSIKHRKTVWELSLPSWSEKYQDLNQFELTSDSKSFVCWPIMRDIAPIGSIGFYSDHVLAPTRQVEEFFDTVGRLVALHLRISSARMAVSTLEQAPKSGDFESLTERQQQILGMIGENKTNLQIAKELGYSSDTIRLDTIKIYKAFGVNNRSEASEKFRKSPESKTPILRISDVFNRKRFKAK